MRLPRASMLRTLRPCLHVVVAGSVLACGTEPIGDVSGEYLLTAQYAGAASECTLTGAQLRLVAAPDGTPSGSLEGGEYACERSDPAATPYIPRPSEVRGTKHEGDLVFSLFPADGSGFCFSFIFTIRDGGTELSGSLRTVQQFCQGLPQEPVAGTWVAEPRPGGGP